MRLAEFFSDRKSEILKRWLDAAIKTYPKDTAQFLKDQKDRFKNPVGRTLADGLEGILDEILSGLDIPFNTEKVSSALDNIIRIRAVQDFKPSEAVAFVFALKEILRSEAEGGEIEDKLEGLKAFDSKIDALSLLAFDVYAGCREKLFEVGANELRRLTFRLVDRANRILGEKEVSAEDIKR